MDDFGIQLAAETEKFAKSKVKYQHRGTSMFGCDCTGMVIGALQNLGFFKNYKLRDYKEDWNLNAGADNHILDEIVKVANKVPIHSLEPGDILVFRFARFPAHVGVFLRENLFAHCYKDAGKCGYGIIKKSPWAKRLIAAYRFDFNRVSRMSNG